MLIMKTKTKDGRTIISHGGLQFGPPPTEPKTEQQATPQQPTMRIVDERPSIQPPVFQVRQQKQAKAESSGETKEQ
jgi:hypothetical protein